LHVIAEPEPNPAESQILKTPDFYSADETEVAGTSLFTDA